MFGISRISISWDLKSDWVLQRLWAFCVERIGWHRASTLETLPDCLRRDVGLLPNEADLEQRDARW